MPIVLYTKLYNRYLGQKWVVFLDNLFLNEPIAYILLYIDIGVIGITRKNAISVPLELLALKDSNNSMTYGSTLFQIIDKALCFAWQDNNTVLSITTAFTLDPDRDNFVLRIRRRLKKSSTNTAISRPIFSSLPIKELTIPYVIDIYNYYIDGINIAN